MNVQDMIDLGGHLQDIEDRAHDLWTHLPSYQIALKFHGDYAMEFRPSPDEIMSEASEFIYAMSQNAEEQYEALTNRMAESYLNDTLGRRRHEAHHHADCDCARVQ